ncbi:MAG: PIG-L family deacetylase [Lewinellaceae bacterium]|nr:PIG-L family deacetylase [Lewinellaceae bacterium]
MESLWLFRARNLVSQRGFFYVGYPIWKRNLRKQVGSQGARISFIWFFFVFYFFFFLFFFHFFLPLSTFFYRWVRPPPLFLLLFITTALVAQKPVKPNAADVHQAIKKLNVLGSVLYVAAHPDDENQRLISYCANEKLYKVTYLSLTRGDGGQNLIGPELRELLGVLRTEELLMARSVDGGTQRFSRANDFGYSKTPEETLRIWDRDSVLSDVAWAMRTQQPDVVINRFYHGDKYSTHGHHTSSAMLSVEAFDMAGRKDIYPEQLQYVDAWQPQRIFFNTSWWFYGSREAFDKADKTNLYPLDLGVYLPLKGKSNNELAAEARSMHRCQGFGSMSSRGESTDWFEFIKGDRPAEKDPFAGINTTWTRVEGGEKIGNLLAEVDRNYRSDNPAASVPELLKAMQMIKVLPEGYWKRVKLAEIKEVIRGCLGLYLEATAAERTATPGDAVKLRLEAVNRSDMDVQLAAIMVSSHLFDTIMGVSLQNNRVFEMNQSVVLPQDASYTAPYWLNGQATLGMYSVPNQELRGLPETPRFLNVKWSLTVNGVPLEYTTDVAYKLEEPARGEVWQPFDVLPPVFVELDQTTYLLTERSIEVKVRVRAGKDNVSGKAMLISPAGWPNAIAVGGNAFSFKRKGEEQTFTFTLQANSGPDQVEIGAGAQIGNLVYTFRMIPIQYDHIPYQSVLQPATAKASRVDVRTTARNIGYYMGAGDEGPAALRLIGCKVTMLEDADLNAEQLRPYDAVVIGIRAYNTKEGLKFHQDQLMKYVENGGTLVTQYNNSFDLVVDNPAPFPMKMSRTRVTDETAEMRFLLPNHPVLNTPNKITAKDFEGWVQERGLYFPSEWDPQMQAPLSSNDPGENPADGALLVANYGKGHYVYTGLSFFRELPAGVPGAYRLFANLISLGKMP